MKTSTKLLIGAAVIGGGALLYKNGTRNLHISLSGLEAGPNGQFYVVLKVVNENKFFGYPVPRLIVNAFDSDNNFIGTILNEQPQYIAANGISFVRGTIQPNFQTLASIIAQIIQGGALPSDLVFHGEMQGPFGLRIPIDTSQSVKVGGIGYYPEMNQKADADTQIIAEFLHGKYKLTCKKGIVLKESRSIEFQYFNKNNQAVYYATEAGYNKVKQLYKVEYAALLD